MRGARARGSGGGTMRCSRGRASGATSRRGAGSRSTTTRFSAAIRSWAADVGERRTPNRPCGGQTLAVGPAFANTTASSDTKGLERATPAQSENANVTTGQNFQDKHDNASDANSTDKSKKGVKAKRTKKAKQGAQSETTK